MCGVPKDKNGKPLTDPKTGAPIPLKTFKDFFIEREITNDKPNEEVPEESDEEIRERKKQRLADMAKARVAASMGIPGPPSPNGG